jgi:CMP-N-acetylneuraminic acid synthetase
MSNPEQSGLQVVALVPMRHHSERVAGKNYLELGGKPLYHHILETLSKCEQVTTIAVDTDSEIIKEGIKESFSEIQIIDRPDDLTPGAVPMNDVLLYDVSEIRSEFYLQTHSTNPFLKAETISKAIRRFSQNYPEHDSLFSVTRLQTRIWDSEARPVNHDPKELLRTQDLPPIYSENSCIYIFDREGFQKRKNRIGNSPLMFEIEGPEAWDIDEEMDFQLAELFMKLA